MPDENLNISIVLLDKMSATLNKIQTGMNGLRDSVEKVGASFTHAGSAMSKAGSSMAMLGGAITAPLILAFNNAAQGSLRLSNTFERIKVSGENLSVSIANSMAPVVERFAGVLQNLVTAWEQLDRPLRDAIVQTTLIGGAFLLLGGILLEVVGKIAKVVGFFITAATWVNPVVLGVAAISAALVLMIQNWDTVQSTVKTVLDGIEVGLITIDIGFQNLRNGILTAMSAIIGAMGSYWELLAKAPGPQQGLFLGLKEGAQTVQAGIAGMVQESKRDVAELEIKLADIFRGKGGSAAIELDKIVIKGKSAFSEIEKFLKTLFGPTSLAPVTKSFDGLKQIAQQTASAMSKSMGTFFFDVVKGKFSDLQTVVASFGDQILQILTSVLAKFILVKTIGASFPGLIPFFHSGGIVRKAHTGMLANDEVPIIAQSGEGIISRRGMQALGKENFNAINNGRGVGGGGGGVTIQITQAITAWDATDVYRNRKALANAVGAEIASNSDIRNIIRKYR